MQFCFEVRSDAKVLIDCTLLEYLSYTPANEILWKGHSTSLQSMKYYAIRYK